MRRPTAPLPIALLAGLFTAGPALCQTVQFQGLGALPGATDGSVAADLSADGTVAVGGSPSTGALQEAWRWTSAGSIEGLGFLPSETTSSAEAISSDGRYIAGSSGADAFRWSSGGGFVAIDDGMLQTVVGGISDDGGTIVGTGHDFPVQPLISAWRWKFSIGIDLAIPGSLSSWTTFYDVSADGQTILASADLFDDNDPFLRTDSATTYLQLDFIPFFCQCGDPPRAMTPDASIVVGQYNWTEAYWWDVAPEEGRLLGYLDPGVTLPTSDALDVSSDGSIVVGSSTDTAGQAAFIWSMANGMQSIPEILESNGIDLTDWVLSEAVAISADGTVILGNGTNPSGSPEAWLAVVPLSAWSRPPVPTLGWTAIAVLASIVLTSGAAASPASTRRLSPRACA